MKIWGKPEIKNLALSHTTQYDINPAAWDPVAVYKCDNCDQTFNALFFSVIEGLAQINIPSLFAPMSEWECSKCGNKGISRICSAS